MLTAGLDLTSSTPWFGICSSWCILNSSWLLNLSLVLKLNYIRYRVRFLLIIDFWIWINFFIWHIHLVICFVSGIGAISFIKVSWKTTLTLFQIQSRLFLSRCVILINSLVNTQVLKASSSLGLFAIWDSFPSWLALGT